ncbi:CHC2 zinc finger domain-containing protein [Streptomyces sp. NEAU-Y11]|uniref:CHC2 zinc finger domain-containing protein n=1 Tax=Streptomyces cucumeris TaxID=2962890 RepID=UPI0020C87B46|nr:CHC2 zinc finger domain-containing protein [Streptomyces sp. NEAU-Y11]MCP9209594.1 CHC2 zinc finger domain-containing protein [Streptomyces sp. NEAU-Y11]
MTPDDLLGPRVHKVIRLENSEEVEVSARPRKDGGFIGRTMITVKRPGERIGAGVQVRVLEYLADASGSALEGIRSALAERGVTMSRLGADHWAACPRHSDRAPSLTVREHERGVFLECHAGCSTGAVLDSLGLSWSAVFNKRRPEGADILVGAESPLTKADAQAILHWLSEAGQSTRGSD